MWIFHSCQISITHGNTHTHTLTYEHSCSSVTHEKFNKRCANAPRLTCSIFCTFIDICTIRRWHIWFCFRFSTYFSLQFSVKNRIDRQAGIASAYCIELLLLKCCASNCWHYQVWIDNQIWFCLHKQKKKKKKTHAVVWTNKHVAQVNERPPNNTFSIFDDIF